MKSAGLLWFGIITVLLCTPGIAGAQLFFPAEVVVPSSGGPKTIATGDLNGDGHADMVVSQGPAADAVFIHLGNGDATFQGPVLYSAGNNPNEVCLSDLDNDGDLDIALTSAGDMAVLAGNGDGTFEPAVLYDVSGYPAGFAINDFDGDGIRDLAVVNWQSSTNLVSLFLGNGDCTFQLPVDVGLASRPKAVVTGDLNGDSIPDLAVLEEYEYDVLILLGNGDGSFTVANSYAVNLSPWDMAIGDLDGDGHLDLAVVHVHGSDIAVLMGRGDGTFRQSVDFDGGYRSHFLLIDDLNGDGRLDLFLTFTQSNRVHYLLGRGDGTFEPFERCFTREDTQRAATLDADGDGHLDVVVDQDVIDAVAILINTAGTTISANLTCSPSAGTMPFTTQLAASVSHECYGQIRFLAARIDLQLAGGAQISGWREGVAHVPYGSTVNPAWNQYIPYHGNLEGDITFTLVVEDVTYAPYNQPPFLHSGQTASALCTVTAGVAR